MLGDNGGHTATDSSGSALPPGTWTLVVRLRADWWEAAVIPVMKIVISAHGEARYEVYDGALNATLFP
ncbi:MAG: hypothetical protein OXG64_03860 [Chloroflexi bacterium]|nr:hypothetical protein [Chloroflexota bacterium]